MLSATPALDVLRRKTASIWSPTQIRDFTALQMFDEGMAGAVLHGQDAEDSRHARGSGFGLLAGALGGGALGVELGHNPDAMLAGSVVGMGVGAGAGRMLSSIGDTERFNTHVIGGLARSVPALESYHAQPFHMRSDTAGAAPAFYRVTGPELKPVSRRISEATYDAAPVHDLDPYINYIAGEQQDLPGPGSPRIVPMPR